MEKISKFAELLHPSRKLVVRCFGYWEPDLTTTNASEIFSFLMFLKADQWLFDYKGKTADLIFLEEIC